MISDKIRADLKKKIKTSKRIEEAKEKILTWLDDDKCCHAVWRVSDIRAALLLTSNSTLYPALYSLAADGRIGFASRAYHIFHLSKHETIQRTRPSKVGTLVWNKNYYASAPIREEWLDDTGADQQLPLFSSTDLESMSNEALKELVDRAQRLQIKRGIDKRYACLADGVRETLTEVFRSISITDPVYFAHSDESISFITYTSVPSMPIDVVLDVGDGPQRMNCKSLTLFGKALVAATDSMFGPDGE